MNNFAKFVETLPIMLQGMVGIFFVLASIYVVIWALNRFTGKSGDEAAND